MISTNQIAKEHGGSSGEEDQRLILLLGRARHQVFMALDRALAERAGVSAVQAGALFYIRDRDGCLLGGLSRGLGLDNSAITGLVDRLERKGLATRAPAPGDRRALRVVLTKAGRRAADRALPVVRAFNGEILHCRPPAEVEGFRMVLEAILEKFSE